jgi:3-phosphoshikimate 1-carboxyvinyltransferase
VLSSIEIQPVATPLNASIRPPGSKSLTNRALVCAALAEGVSNLHGVLASEDTQVMIEGLRALGIEIAEDSAKRTLRVTGCGGRILARSADLYVANSGTTVRFLTALAALGRGTFRLHGTKRMHERPIQDLLNSLAELGVRAESESGTGCPPVIVHADGLRAGRTRMRGDVSSQYLSAVLMAAPCASAGDAPDAVVIDIEGDLVSKPYVAMTIAVIEAFGGRVETAGDGQQFSVALTGYVGRDYDIEPDASAASYLWAAAAIAGGRVRVEGLNRGSLQGDVAFCECLAQMGCEILDDESGMTVVGGPLRGINVDMNAISDTVPTLGVVALFADGPTTIRRVGHIRHKETDRIRALATELRKLGATVDEFADGLRIAPGALHGATIDTYDDHRMAMSLALAGLKIPGVVINDPQCTAKTYPEFFQDLASLTAAGRSHD